MYDAQFAAVYDHIYRTLNDYSELAQMVVDLAVEHGANTGGSLLDVGCGTGEHLRYLRKDFDVVGIDLSQPMVDLAREKQPDLEIHQGDMCDFDLGRTFDVICSMFSSIGYLSTVEQLNDAVASMARHLAPGGVLVVEPWVVRERWTGGQLAHLTVERDDLVLQRMGQWHTEGPISKVDMHYLLSGPDGVRHFVNEQRLRLYSLDEYQEAFRLAGLNGRLLLDRGKADRGVFVATREG
ncbi:class I SAM-dependent methyltransferase [Streptomyces sp. DSM 44915]|uniref:Class I SAM-dependent methyltransferase n=1 Tax=Streptomyces chisholmiae TaxID=3075540 RepID=A0ABU2JSV1_9ACTN|nr:class I SAM-dependent methyltransferase [Streptomyces sp. DSM 44915]MDT0268062.1 class I SAM-dependent methyltransferase [Streptomyces sp. DSM 44915]